MKITICGGGNLGHVCAGVFGSAENHQVSILTTHPDRWANVIEVTGPNGEVYKGVISMVSSNPQDVIPNADIVLVCLPGFAIHGVLTQVAPCLDKKTIIGTVVSSTGFFFEAMKIFPPCQPLFGFQRVPFISRTTVYGHSAELKGYKESLSVAVEQTKDKNVVRRRLEQLFKTPIILLDNFYEVSLSNSNPLLHTSRLYTMWHDWKSGMVYKRNPLFYTDWTCEASEILIAMDEEFQSLLQVIGVRKGAVPPILQYYECHDAKSLTEKIQSIPAFQGIYSPMKETDNGWVPDFTSRYFIEDFPYGLKQIYDISKEKNVRCEYIEMVYNWGISVCQSWGRV